MEKTTRVRNIMVFDSEQFQEDLVKELIVNNISYVQIENEFHFLDKIYRIYDLGKINCNLFDVTDNFSLFSDDSIKMSFATDISLSGVPQKKNVSYTKKMIREDNRRANDRFKGSVNNKLNNFRR